MKIKTTFTLSVLALCLLHPLFQENNTKPLMVKAENTTDIWDGSTVTKPSIYDEEGITLSDGNKYIPITTAAEYAYIASNSDAWSKNYILMTDLDFSITESSSVVAPLIAYGDTSKTFTGILNGNGHNISNVHHYFMADKSYLGSYYVGLVGTNEGTICNLAVSNISFTVLHNTSGFITKGYAGLYVGAIAGLNEGIISNITVMNSSIYGTNNQSIFVGGIAGYQKSLSSKNATVENCVLLETEVKFYGPTNTLGNGGLVTSGNGGTVSNCYTYDSNLVSEGRGTNNSSNYKEESSMEDLVNDMNESLGGDVFNADGTLNRTPEMEAAERVTEFYSSTFNICDDIERVPELLEEYESLNDVEKELFKSSGMYDRLMYLKTIYDSKHLESTNSSPKLLPFTNHKNEIIIFSILGLSIITSIIAYTYFTKKRIAE
ncbi:MAG: hypothetical protein J1F31_00210 [Erysipelotrichales bacterium]|nr:hypothetical protein [Erysipelotrichales bacterium]